ncbi:MAG: alpha/beta fold hydrolase [Lapillicoccus sp.]
MTASMLCFGQGPGVVVVGGALRSAEDYTTLGHALAARGWRACVLQRRARPETSPRRPGDGIEEEVADLADACREVSAVAVLGHSFGGLVCLEAAARGRVNAPVVVYEPGVSVGGSLPAAWVGGYRARLTSGRRHAAFAHFVKHSTGSPAIARRLPEWYLSAVLRVALRRTWDRIDPLLEANADEHLIVAACNDRVQAYGAIRAPVLALGGAKSPPALVQIPFYALAAAIPDITTRILPGLDHFAPDDKDPARIAAEVDVFLRGLQLG